MTGLVDLPSELIADIVAYLPDNDVFATRVAAKQLERASFSHFGKRFFRKKGYMLTSSSLSVLQQIADHAELRKYVQHIWFNPDLFTFVHPECAPDPQETPDPENPNSLLDVLAPSDRKKYEAYILCMDDHTLLIKDSAAKLETVLKDVFANLPNLEVIGMRRSEDHSPWGWRTLRDAVGEDPRVLGPIPSGMMYRLSGPTNLFLAIINGVAATDTKLRRLYTDAIEIDNIRPDLLPQETLDKACNSIWYLETNITKGSLRPRKKANYITLLEPVEDYAYYDHGTIQLSDYPLSPPGLGNGVVKLLKATANLKEIGLQIFPDRKQSHMIPPDPRNPESWRTSYPYRCLENITTNVQLQHLSRIKLEKITISPSLLQAFLTPSQSTLTSLKLRDIRLLADSTHTRPWQPVLALLRDNCPNLDYLLLDHLFHGDGGVNFDPNPPAPPPAPPGFPTDAGPFALQVEHVTIEVRGVQEVHEKVAEMVEGHWYLQKMFSYEMEEGLWDTDTSDEEW